eukprot:scaffold322461_cov39-Tisochrysis_lutea.AAC.3
MNHSTIWREARSHLATLKVSWWQEGVTPSEDCVASREIAGSPQMGHVRSLNTTLGICAARGRPDRRVANNCARRAGGACTIRCNALGISSRCSLLRCALPAPLRSFMGRADFNIGDCRC